MILQNRDKLTVADQPEATPNDLERAFDAERFSPARGLGSGPAMPAAFAAPPPHRRQGRRRTNRLLTFLRSFWIIIRERPRD